MNKQKKYPKVNGSWTYGHIVVPVKLIYIGSSSEPKCSDRWSRGGYKRSSLQPYIEEYGWENIEHIVFKDGLTPKQAEQLEDLLIEQATIDGWCINERRSGGESRDNTKEYRKQYYQDNIEEISKKQKKYNDSHKDEKKQYDEYYYNKNKEKIKNYKKQQRSTPQGKIYNRVHNYNRINPDKVIETPLEAKNKYLEYGYIPSYIKNNDLQ